MLTISQLKEQKRWCLWRMEPGPNGKDTKVPHQISGYKADITNPAHLRTFAEVEPHAAKLSGIGLALGRFDGVYVWGVDFDKCCDASGNLTVEVREIIAELESYAEHSPSKTGAHCLGTSQTELPVEPGNKKQVVVRPHPGCKQIEIKGLGFYFTFTGSRIEGTPENLIERTQQIHALYQRVRNMSKPKDAGLTVALPVDAEEKFAALMKGDMHHYDGDHSRADIALCVFLAKKHGCNAFKIDTEFRKSELYRDDKWEREDYRERTIKKAITMVLQDGAMLPCVEVVKEKEHTTHRPTYADDVWEGTIVGEFAKLCSRDNHIPRKLYAESFRTVLGAVMGDRLRCPDLERCNARAFTVIVAPFGKGKGTAIRRATDFFRQTWSGVVSTPGLTVQGNVLHGLLSGHRDFMWKPKGIGAWSATANSVPGMMKLSRDTDETMEKHPELTWGATLPRILSVHEEMKTFFSPIFIEGGVGDGLYGVFCQLWDAEEFHGPATQHRDALYGQMMFSILGGVTHEDWFDLITRGNAVGGGLMSRLNIVGTEGHYANVPKIAPVDFSPLQEAFLPRVRALADMPVLISADERATRTIAEWADRLPDGSERMNVQCWRSALVLAWLRNKERIDEPIAQDAVRLAQYQVESHAFYQADAADNQLAKIQANIERTLTMKGPLSRRDLQRWTNARRVGTDQWAKALTGLIRDGRVGQREEGRYFIAA
jgi:hypothetical protein